MNRCDGVLRGKHRGEEREERRGERGEYSSSSTAVRVASSAGARSKTAVCVKLIPSSSSFVSYSSSSRGTDYSLLCLLIIDQTETAFDSTWRLSSRNGKYTGAEVYRYNNISRINSAVAASCVFPPYVRFYRHPGKK